MKYFVLMILITLGCLGFLVSSMDFDHLTSSSHLNLESDDQVWDSDRVSASASQELSGRELGLGSPSSPKLVLMKFGAPWCPPCRMIDNELRKLERSELPVEIRKINVDEQPELASRYGVSNIPRLILLQDGRKVGDLIGYKSSEELAAWIKDEASEAALAVKKRSSMPSVVQANPFFK